MDDGSWGGVGAWEEQASERLTLQKLQEAIHAIDVRCDDGCPRRHRATSRREQRREDRREPSNIIRNEAGVRTP